MKKDHSSIRCEGHGNAQAAYVCTHIFENPTQRWFGSFPEANNLWPDAWCSSCQASFLREGEWNERNEIELKVKTICSGCYTEARCQSVLYPDEAEKNLWDGYVGSCCAELERKQEKFRRDFGIDKYKRWDWDQATGQLVFSNKDVPAVIADFVFIGSVSTASNTWLWAWANFSLAENLRKQGLEVRETGERENFPHLAEARWSADEHDGWDMAAVAVHVLGAIGVYRTPGESGTTFLALMSARKV